MWVNHSAAKYFNPALTLTKTASLAATFKAAYIHLGTRLCEWEMMWSELNLSIFTE